MVNIPRGMIFPRMQAKSSPHNTIGSAKHGFEDRLYPGSSKEGLNISNHIKSLKYGFSVMTYSVFPVLYTIKLNSILSSTGSLFISSSPG